MPIAFAAGDLFGTSIQLLLASLGLFAVWLLARRFLRRELEESDQPEAFTLQDLRDMVKNGQLTQAEYEAEL